MLVIAGYFDIDPANAAIASEASAKMGAASREEEGCIDYAWSIDCGDGGRLRIFECWKDQAALDTHFGLPHMAEFQGAMANFGMLGGEVLKYHVSSTEPMA